ncbi:MAG: cryptochrome/photolyase family protein, partial [Methylobacteriaceae bacterium]|nr:cryptochrome/photolyase family protein [Methylobacteriaceae bacterium]
RDDTRFFATRADFRRWAEGRRTYRMEFFYREMRRRTGILMDGDQPEGGEWNFDKQNRKPLPRDISVNERRIYEADAVTRGVLDLVGEFFARHFGDLEPFQWAITREEALVALDEFIEYALPSFGDYQDAMSSKEPFLFHSILSPYINAGLLLPREVVQRAEEAYRDGGVPLNAAEGFIRQILGWREYIRGIYWLKMPDYAESNFFNATRPLPSFYWTGETRSNCLHHCISGTKRHAYEHHIQRLMVTGNFALIAGFDPAQVEEWYLIVFADAYEWVELPNTHGMILYADGGLLGSKPYAASGTYINKMSDYCRGCTYDVRQRSGPDACPFNYLYWDFLIRNRAKLEGNPRLKMPYRTLDEMQAERVAEIRADAARYLNSLTPSQPGDY